MESLVNWCQSYTDFTLRAKDGKEFRCHKRELSEGSDFFKAMLSKDCKETTDGLMTVPDFEGQILAFFLQHLYAGSSGSAESFDSNNYSMDLLAFADQYQCQKLLQDGIDHLKKNITHENAVDVWVFASRLPSGEQLKDIVKNYMVKAFIEKPGALESQELAGFEDMYQVPEFMKEILRHIFKQDVKMKTDKEGTDGEFHVKVKFQKDQTRSMVFYVSPDEKLTKVEDMVADEIGIPLGCLAWHCSALVSPRIHDYGSRYSRYGQAQKNKTLRKLDIESGHVFIFKPID